MSCPRCGLVVPLRASYLKLSRCPRCLAGARIAVPMFLSPDPATDVAGEVSLEELVIRAQQVAGETVLELSGVLDVASAPALQQQLEAAPSRSSRRIVVDLSGLEFLDSAGLQVLLYADRRLRESGQALFLRRGSRAIQRVFELTHTLAIFRFED